VKQPSDVLDHLKFVTTDSHNVRASDEQLYQQLEQRASDLIHRYLEGEGVPDHEITREVVSPEEFARLRGNKTVRAAEFAKSCSGSELIPLVDNEWKVCWFYFIFSFLACNRMPTGVF
jgi:hypothetical protein